ncbi:MAG: TonB-dependent receptor domain-containing protein, partial [Gammaproteobacteria bacterium]
QRTTMRLLDIVEQKEERSVLELIIGAFQSFSRAPRSLAVNTPYVNGLIEGTEFLVRVEAEQTAITVFEGKVAATNEFGRLLLARGESAVAKKGDPPRPQVVVRPRDAVQWALYYPLVLEPGRVPADVPINLRKAMQAAGRGDTVGAFEALEGVPETEQGARFRLYRAALLLNVGRVDEAQADIDRALALDPKASLAHTLRSVIKVAQNEQEQALADGERAVALEPQSAAAHIALSYAQQARFDLEQARDTLLKAVEAEPDNALAWARLAELWLMLGYRNRSLDAAQKATELKPNLPRTHIVKGFADLAAFRTQRARQAFDQAIALDPADPLPHLGRGLSLIRESRLEEGRKDLEIAVGLDGNDSLLRSYLGKAYFEEKRDPLDAQQFQIAKELDPLDPTPYLYDGIRKQTENMPVPALKDVQKSIKLNDNRAVYRNRQQLDADRAARQSSLARVYNDLGFTQLGLDEAGKSLALDPSNTSAHRFLSDTYRGVRRREISRVSELLQAQMLQDVNINPVQPSFSETNLNIVTRSGPTEAGFNEFTPLFERNDVQLNATGVFGNQDTIGGEGVVSALYDWFALSLGAFHYETDGWRRNNDLQHDIYNIFAQAAITPELNVQGEYRHRDTEFGDLQFDFDPNDVAANARNGLDQDIGRVGLRYSPAPHSDILFSYIRTERDETASDEAVEEDPFLGPVLVSGKLNRNQTADQIEGQYIFKHDGINVIAGFGFTNSDSEEPLEFAFDGIVAAQFRLDLETDDHRGYVYTNINFPQPVTWTIGVSYADYQQKGDSVAILDDTVFVDPLKDDVDEISPKFGVQWDVTPDLRARAAYLEVVKPPITSNRTLEPTQVAGFNQFFDDIDGTESTRYGFGLDWQVVSNLAIGGEVTWREIDEPFINLAAVPNTFVRDEADEQSHQAYVYWTPIEELAVRTGFVYDKFKRDSAEFASEVGNQNPLDLETISWPVSATYFHPSGFFAAAGVTYVDQEVKRLEIFSNQGEDNFVTVDLGAGFRFPDRWGIASIQVQNLLDEEFKFQDDSFREFRDEPSVGPYIPDRTIMGRITLNF